MDPYLGACQPLLLVVKQVFKDSQRVPLGRPDVGVVALLGLVAGRHHIGASVQTIAVLTDGRSEVHSEAKLGNLGLESLVGPREFLGLLVDLRRIPRQEGCQQGVGVYGRGYSRSMSAWQMIPILRR